MQDYISAIAVIGLLWLVVKLAFGGSNGSAQGVGSNSARGMAGGPGSISKETAAAQAWRESKDERQRQLKERKLEMIETARRRLLEQKQASEYQAKPALEAQSNELSSSSSIRT